MSVTHFLLLGFLVHAIVLGTSARKFISVDPETHQFVDPEGRTRFFHGVNVVYKLPPYYPRLDGFDPQLSLCEKDLQDLERWGFNAIRLHTSWEGAAIEEGSFNDTYVDTLRSIVDSLEKHGIYALMDMHQDVISPFFCGEGMPDWLVKKIRGGLEFPQPVATHIDVDPNTGYPLLEECLKREFALYYLTDAVGIVFQKLYENTDGVQDHYVDFWKHIVPKFADSPNVLGYELLNEPYFGDIYAHPSLLKSGETDKKYLQPMYERLHKEIRQIDDEHMIFYEPVVADLLPMGFTHGPGGAEYDDRQVLSYHVYCGDVDHKGDPRSTFICEAGDRFVLDARVDQVRYEIGGGMFLSEFGAVSNHSHGVDEIDWLLGEADRNLQSWSYWQFKWYKDPTTADQPAVTESFYDVDGALEVEKVKVLSRTYAPAVAGKVQNMTFSSDDGSFQLRFQYDKSVNAPTIIFANKDLWYANGLSVKVTPEGALTWKEVKTNHFEFDANPDLPDTSIITLCIIPV